MIDSYTKTILTVIALALSVIAYNQFSPATAVAQVGLACGEKHNPCFIEYNGHGVTGLPVKVMN